MNEILSEGVRPDMGMNTPCALVSQPHGSGKAFSLGKAQRDGKSSGGGQSCADIDSMCRKCPPELSP